MPIFNGDTKRKLNEMVTSTDSIERSTPLIDKSYVIAVRYYGNKVQKLETGGMVLSPYGEVYLNH